MQFINRTTTLFVLLSVLSLLGCSAAPPSPLATATETAIPTATATPNLPEDIELSDELTIRHVRPGVYIITHAFPWPANSMLVEMADGSLVLVDTPYTPEATQQVLDWITERFGQRSLLAINTGFHVDNLGGNSALIEAGIPVYGSELTPELLRTQGEASREQMLAWLEGPENVRYHEAHAAIPYVAATRTYPLVQGYSLDLGDESVIIHYPGHTHTPDNVVVYFPETRVLFGGCMILAGDTVGNVADADVMTWPQAVRTLTRFDADIVVPGHGDRFDPGLIEHTLELLAQ